MILLTGATGKTGFALAQRLSRQGTPFRVNLRNSEQANRFSGMGCDIVVGDLTKPQARRQALAGVEQVCLILANFEGQQATEQAIIQEAAEQGVQRVVKLSSIEAHPDIKARIPQSHFQVEQSLKASGLDYCMVRPNFFMQNLLANMPSIQQNGSFSYPAAGARTAMIDIEDVADFMAAVLQDRSLRDQSFDISGPEILSFEQVATTIGQQLGREVAFQACSAKDLEDKLKGYLDPWQTEAVVELLSDLVLDQSARLSDDFEAVLKRPPRSLQEFVAGSPAFN
ncbi:NmrA family NAD(P)-binding protein [Paraferrimonas sedimenticola]|uniref:NAD(P)-dependent oxidoreductase n=1 Tax=Paraferrimonas sedimenticola TaxID=375674 RepID=A0AA37W182_9GAMM|nr:NAD(P)H-binding protein [Paraferrimonas sedimenticola]GLP95997.1 NAD(P)-dependent oxidoreductase [Paraferrimonas sedimenticola]